MPQLLRTERWSTLQEARLYDAPIVCEICRERCKESPPDYWDSYEYRRRGPLLPRVGFLSLMTFFRIHKDDREGVLICQECSNSLMPLDAKVI